MRAAVGFVGLYAPALLGWWFALFFPAKYVGPVLTVSDRVTDERAISV